MAGEIRACFIRKRFQKTIDSILKNITIMKIMFKHGIKDSKLNIKNSLQYCQCINTNIIKFIHSLFMRSKDHAKITRY